MSAIVGGLMSEIIVKQFPSLITHGGLVIILTTIHGIFSSNALLETRKNRFVTAVERPYNYTG
jgi:hypothetical protein